jgi:aspartate/methionine/tyrosine aminotransferase
MEDWLEEWRLKARYDLGESGHRSRTVGELLAGAGIAPEQAAQAFLSMPLHDSPNRGRADLRQLVSSFHEGASADDVLITTGTSEALFLLFRALAPRKVALLLPAFQLLYEIPARMGATIVGLPVRFDDSGLPRADWDLWFEILRRERPDAVVFNHPHNPSGLCFTAAEIAELSRFCEARGIRLVADEHYRFLSTESVPLGPTSFSLNGTTAVTGSFIKCTGTPGLRLGWYVGPRGWLDVMQNEKNYTTHTVNPVAEWMALCALGALLNPASALSVSMRGEWELNRTTLSTFLARNLGAWQGSVPAGGLVCVLTHASWSDAHTFERHLAALLTAGVFLLPLSTMEFAESYMRMGIRPNGSLECGRGVRLGLGCSPALFEEAMELISVTVR